MTKGTSGANRTCSQSAPSRRAGLRPRWGQPAKRWLFPFPERACVDLPYMAQLLRTEDQDGIVRALQGAIFRDPSRVRRVSRKAAG